MNELFNKTCLTNETEKNTLVALLENSKKNRVKSVASRYGVKLSDKNTKQQMTQAAAPAIEVSFGIKLKQYSKEDLGLLLDCFRYSEVSEATAAAAKISQLKTSQKFSFTTLTSNEDSRGVPAQVVLNIRIKAAAPIRPTTAGRSQPITPAKTLFPFTLS